MRNHSDVDLRIYKGDRVAQLVVEKILEVDVNCVEELTSTDQRLSGIRILSSRRPVSVGRA